MTVMLVQWEYLVGCLLASGVGTAFGYWLAVLFWLDPLRDRLREVEAQLARQNRRLESVRRPSPEETFRQIAKRMREES
jgi:uncharacterized membrane protein YciS (DUF1049 family)